jgi:hypothetical protein
MAELRMQQGHLQKYGFFFIFDEHDKLHPLSAAFLRRLPESHKRWLWSGLQERIQLLWRALQ